MKRISTYIVTLVLALAGSSCSDYLDKEYDASLSEKKVFNNQNLTREFLANIYTNLPDGLAPLSDDQFTGASRDCMTDNAVTCWDFIIIQRSAATDTPPATIPCWASGTPTYTGFGNVICF